MARQLLIVEDNDGVAHLLEEIASELGVTATRARGGTEAIAKLSPLPDAVVCDLVLGELDGFSVAKALRALPGGEAVPLIVISGVYRQLPPPFVEATRPFFLAKPFEHARLREALEEGWKRQDQAQGLLRGRFLSRSPAALLVDLFREKRTGILEVTLGEIKRRLFVHAGQIRFGQSNVKTESAGGLAMAAHQLDEGTFERVVQHARAHRVPLWEALSTAGGMPASEAQAWLSAQTAAVAAGVLSMLGAEWVLSAAEVGAQPDTPRHPIVAIVEAAKSEAPADAREALLKRSEATVERTDLLDQTLFLVRAAWPQEAFTPLVQKQQPLSDLLARTRTEDLPLAWALVDGGLLRLSQPAPSASEQAAAPATQDEDRGRTFTEPEQAARAAIFSERERTKSFNHYELFGVSPQAPVEEVRRAYLERVRRYHSDRYAGLSLGSAARALEELFQRANEAMDTLGDGERRAEYDILLARQAAGLPTDVGAILAAEQVFQTGVALLKSGKAAEALERFREAVGLNPAEAEFHAYLGYALWRAQGPEAADRARAGLDQAREGAPRSVNVAVLGGLFRRDLGDREGARQEFERALELDPKNEEAARELRHLGQQEKRGRSLFGRLFRR